MNGIGVTFFVWADTHCGYLAPSHEAGWHARIIEQMKTLPGRRYPAWIGGAVDEPRAVLHVGDMVDGQKTAGVELACYRRMREKLPWQHIEAIGNHDLDPVIQEDFIHRHGSEFFTREVGGVRVASVCVRYGPEGESIDRAQLAWLEQALAEEASDAPVVLLAHSPLAGVAQGSELLASVAARRRVLVLAGHLHRPRRYALGGAACVDVGHCRDHPIDRPFGRNFYVVRITDDRMTAVPWRWDQRDWEKGIGWADPTAAAQSISLDVTAG